MSAGEVLAALCVAVLLASWLAVLRQQWTNLRHGGPVVVVVCATAMALAGVLLAALLWRSSTVREAADERADRLEERLDVCRGAR